LGSSIHSLPSHPAAVDREILATLVENAADLIVIATAEGRTMFLNQSGYRLLGLHPDSTLPPTLSAYLDNTEQERFVNVVMPVLHGEGRWAGELTFSRQDTGDSFPVVARLVFIGDEADRRSTIAMICRDISEQKESQRRLAAAQEELAHATRLLSLGELTASIAHEVNQPLAAIVADGNACIRWLNHDPPQLTEALSSVERIIRDANHASAVIARIRDFSVRNGPTRARIDLNTTIRDVLAIVSDLLSRQKVLVHSHLTRDIPRVLGDRIQVQQVILNLVLNAVDAMRDSDLWKELTITTASDGAFVHTSVRDTGKGIPDSDLHRMFEPFFTTKPHGMGLGLSISRRIIEAHGGRLSASSNYGGGLTLNFTLPRATTMVT
jgi:PAS domain S-box-containing protein